MKPRFQHDCDRCTFLGQGFFHKKPVDWYVCPSRQGLRTVIARRSDEPSEYASATIGETVAPCPLVIAALAQGLELLEPEKDKLLSTLLRNFRGDMGMAFWEGCMPPDSEEHNQIGNANWLGIDL